MASSFDTAKFDLLSKLSCGVDFSPKGSIDLPVLELVKYVNNLSNYVTTSSCSGRISVYLNENLTKGIRWILVKHRSVKQEEVAEAISNVESHNSSLVVLKCEAFILHVSCRDIECGRILHQLAMGCGFRESGISIGQKKVIVAIRTTAFNLELPLARGSKLLVDEDYLSLIVSEANLRLRNNFARADKLLVELKKLFQFPSLKVIKLKSELDNKIRRWGHVSTPFSGRGSGSSAYQVSGGYGVDTSLQTAAESEKCVRGLPSVTCGDDEQSHNISCAVNGSVHAAGVAHTLVFEGNEYSVHLLSGGRTSPQSALSCLATVTVRNLSADMNEMSVHVTELCDADTTEGPQSRWGHSLTAIGSDSFLLYGGRDATGIFSDAYVLTISLTAISAAAVSQSGALSLKLLCKWRKLALHTTTDLMPALLPLPVARFFHAAVPVEDVYVDEEPRSYVLLHGGVTSIEDPTTSGEAFVVDPWSGAVQYITMKPLLESSSSAASTTEQLTVDEGLGAAAITNSITNHSTSALPYVKRFGHTLTKVGGKTILLVGGASFDQASNLAVNRTENETVAMDLTMTGSGEYALAYRVVSVATDVHHTDSAEVTSNTLPCQECRSHHTALFNAEKNTLLVDGGGLMCLAFGSHLCSSMEVRVANGADAAVSEQQRGSGNGHSSINSGKSGNSSKKSAHAQQSKELLTASKPTTTDIHCGSSSSSSSSNSSSSSSVVLVAAGNVKRVKVLLEQRGLANKALSISKVGADSGSLLRATKFLSSVAPAAFDKGEEVTAQSAAEFVLSADVKPVVRAPTKKVSSPISDDSSATSTKPSKPAVSSAVATRSAQDIMGVPVTNDFVDLLWKGALSAELTHALCEAVGTSGIVVASLSEGRVSKRVLSNTFQQANEFVLQTVSRHNLPALLPSKYEVVGDFLMIPSDALCGPEWEQFLAHDRQRALQFWSSLAGIFSLEKVARKSVIDSGVLRESKVVLLLPDVGVPADTGPGALGWNTVLENRIQYSFDITRVMFCSGNITEKIRMASQPDSAGNVVVDFYCGVGYYTVPLLVHGKAAHVYACEWNPNSVLALRENLKNNKVASDRYTILQGNNQETTGGLVDLADRILLGLLPSSVAGWPLAARAIKPTGGIVHVHENVTDKHMDSWVAETCLEFERLLSVCGKSMTVTKVHLEKVKSYAPHIYHVVLDIKCEPI